MVPASRLLPAITVQNNLRLAPRRPTGRFTVLKVPNRTLVRSERQDGRSAFSVPLWYAKRLALPLWSARTRSVHRSPFAGPLPSKIPHRTADTFCQRADTFFAGAPLCLTYVHFRPMDADLQAMVDAGKLNIKAAAALDQLKPQTFCLHKSWGFGQISSWNLLLNQIVVDFDTKKNHSMQLQFTPLKPCSHCPTRTFSCARSTSQTVLRDLATNKIPQLIELVLESFGGKATQDQLQRALAPEIVSEGNFKKWWESAKRAIRKDGRFSLPAKKTEPITIRDESTSFEDEVINLFQKARKLKDQLNYLDQILKNLETFAGKENELQTVVSQIEEIATRNTRLNPSQAIELLISRDELCAKLPELKKGAIALPDLLKEHQHKLGEIISQVPANKQRRVLAEFPLTFPNDWSTRLLSILQSAGYRVIGEIAKILVEQGQTEELRQALNRAIKEHSISSEALFWLCKERGAGSFARAARLRIDDLHHQRARTRSIQ